MYYAIVSTTFLLILQTADLLATTAQGNPVQSCMLYKDLGIYLKVSIHMCKTATYTIRCYTASIGNLKAEKFQSNCRVLLNQLVVFPSESTFHVY